ncbi:MAG: PadR family transcriptional regulator, partial [Candidatus Sericytochromatia bacterium]
PELASLTKEGLVTFEVVAQTSKPNKKVYTITETGREALAEWVASPREKRTVKDPLLMRVWSLGMVPPELALPQLREALEEYEQRLAMLQEIEAEAGRDEALGMSAENTWIGAALALSFGQKAMSGYRDWLKEAINHLEAVTAAPAS